MSTDDAKLTAYALGELDAADCAEIERLLESSAEARETVKTVRRTGAWLTESLRAEAAAALSPAQREAIESAANQSRDREGVPSGAIESVTAPSDAGVKRDRRWTRWAVAASLMLLVGVGGYWVVLSSLSRAREFAPTYARAPQQEVPLPANPTNGASRVPLAHSNAQNVSDPLALAYQAQGGQGAPVASPMSPAQPGQPAPNQWAAIRELNATPKQWMAPGADSRMNSSAEDAHLRASLSLAHQMQYVAKDGKTWAAESISQELFPNSTVASPHAARARSFFDARSVPSAPPMTPGRRSDAFLDGGAVPCQPRPLPIDPTELAPGQNTESYDHIADNAFLRVLDQPLSTFSIDVDTASYANIRRFLTAGQLPPKDAVRIEEMVNYFSYDYPAPSGDDPFSVNVEVAQCPWNMPHRLVRIGLRGKTFAEHQRPPCNLVFLIDVSGSMEPANKLPLLKQAMGMLVEKLGPSDRVAIVTYAGSSGLALPSTTANNKSTIMRAIEALQAGGCTNGGEGIQLAYRIAQENLNREFVNRVILATDGDFNVGITNQNDLVGLIEQKAKSGVFLSVLGFGMGNLKDATLERLADKGNGNYAYIDTLGEARKVLVDQMAGTLVTIAKDVKIQIEFNPAVVGAYRLIGYENRMLAARDFNDDRKDAGEIGAGHTVTALYELVPAGQPIEVPGIEPLKYQTTAADGKVLRAAAVAPDGPRLTAAAHGGEMMTVKLRYKQPDGDTSTLLEKPVTDGGAVFLSTSADFRFAAAVAAFGMVLRESPHKGDSNFDSVLEFAQGAIGTDAAGYRAEFVDLVRKAKAIASGRSVSEPRP